MKYVVVTFSGDFAVVVRDQADADARGIEIQQQTIKAIHDAIDAQFDTFVVDPRGDVISIEVDVSEAQE